MCIFFVPREYGGASTLAIVLCTCLVITIVKAMEESNQNKQYNLLTSDAFLYVGKISYSLYLWHWSVIVISKWTIGIQPIYVPLLFLLMFGFAAFSYHFIEEPLRHISWRRTLKPKFVLIPLTVIWFLYFLSLSPLISTKGFYLGEKNDLNKYSNSKLLNALDDKSKFSTIRILGNSHSNHIVPMINVVSKKSNSKVIYEESPKFITIPFGDGADIHKLSEVLSSLHKEDLLILSSRFRFLYEQPYLNSQGDTWVDHSEEKKEKGYGLESWLNELNLVIEESKKAEVNVILFMPTVEFDVEVPNKDLCKDEWFRNPDKSCYPTVSKEYLNNRFPKEFYEEVQKLSELNSNFFVFNPIEIYCPEKDQSCSRIVNGVIAFRDTNHLTEEGALLMLDSFLSFLISHKLW